MFVNPRIASIYSYFSFSLLSPVTAQGGVWRHSARRTSKEGAFELMWSIECRQSSGRFTIVLNGVVITHKAITPDLMFVLEKDTSALEAAGRKSPVSRLEVWKRKGAPRTLMLKTAARTRN